MKRLVCILLALAMLIVLCACGETKAEAPTAPAETETPTAPAETEAPAEDDGEDAAALAALWEQYAEACKALNSGDYQQAAEAFTALGSFEDSAELAALAGSRQAYSEAKALLDNGYYEQAAAAFSALGSFEDSVQQAEIAESWQQYLRALALLDAGDFEQAIELFSALAPFEDSAAQAELAQTRIELSEAKDELQDARRERDEALAAQKEAEDALLDQQYETAENAYANRDYTLAREVLSGLGDYRESASMLTDIDFLRDISTNVVDIRAMETAGAPGELAEALQKALSALEGYEQRQFKDPALEASAAKYIKGLEASLAGLGYGSDSAAAQIERQSGFVGLAEAIGELNEQFGLFSETPELLDAYLGTLPREQEMLKALQEIDADLREQLGAASDSVNGGKLVFPVTNNTEYRYNVTFYCTLRGAGGENGAVLGQVERAVNRILPRGTTTVYMNLPAQEWERIDLTWVISGITTPEELQQEWAYWNYQQQQMAEEAAAAEQAAEDAEQSEDETEPMPIEEGEELPPSELDETPSEASSGEASPEQDG